MFLIPWDLGQSLFGIVWADSCPSPGDSGRVLTSGQPCRKLSSVICQWCCHRSWGRKRTDLQTLF